MTYLFIHPKQDDLFKRIHFNTVQKEQTLSRFENELKSFKAEVFWVMVKYVQYSGQKIGGTETYMKNDFPNGYNACQYFHSYPNVKNCKKYVCPK